MKNTHIIGGGTVSYVRSHLALSAPAYGETAKKLHNLCELKSDKLNVITHLTRMAGGSKHLETPEDISKLIDGLILDSDTKIIFMNAAICDFKGAVDGISGKREERLSSRLDKDIELKIEPTKKLISKIRKHRKDIFLVGFKHTCNKTLDEQYIAGLNLLKESSANLVLSNDAGTKFNMIITPEEARYHITNDREEALSQLVDMAYLRSHLTFTRSTVINGNSISWDSNLIPQSLKSVVDFCIKKGAYKPFRGVTVGHFACKVNDTTFVTSKRKTNFNDLDTIGLVKIETDGPDSVIAYGSKPSVGGQSQRIIFDRYNGYNCIVHFHCPIKPNSLINQVSQREYECGSHECGQNTSNGLSQIADDVLAVYLKEHGPNIVFKHTVDPKLIIQIIEDNFDLNDKTGGPISLGQILKTPDTLDTLVNI